MKNFTFFLVLIFTVLLANGQNSTALQKRVEAAKEKHSRVTRLNSLLNNYSIALMKWNLSSEKFLKSAAAATMKLDSTVIIEKNSVTGEWEKEMKDEYAYNAEMKNTVLLSSDWNKETGSWEADSKIENEYNPDGSVSIMRMYDSSDEEPGLKLETTFKAFYNSAGQLDSVEYWTTEEQQQKLTGKQYYEYNESGQLVKMKMWSLMEDDDDNEEFLLVSHREFTYTATGKTKTSSSYSVMEETEIMTFKTEHYYDSSDRLIHTEDRWLNYTSFQLEKTSRTDYDYNSEGDISTETYSNWDSDQENWEPYEKDEYTYNSFSFPNTHFPSFFLLFGVVETPTFGKAPDEINTYEMEDATLEHTSKMKFYYSTGTSTFAEKISDAGFSVYPNPASDKVTFNWKENKATLFLEIYQVAGARILKEQVSSGIPVSLAGMDDGIYLFKLNDGKQTIHTGKLIKR